MKAATLLPAAVIGLIAYTAFGSCWRTIPRVNPQNNTPVRACSMVTPTAPPFLCDPGHVVTQNEQLTDATSGWNFGKVGMGAVQKICQHRYLVRDANGDCVFAYSSESAGSTEATGGPCPALAPPGGPSGPR